MIEIDKLYKEKFKSYGRKPSSDAWAKIQMEMQKEGKKPAAPIVFNKKLLLAASLALLLVLGYQQWTKTQLNLDPTHIATSTHEISEIAPLAQVPLPTEVVSEESSSPIETLTAVSYRKPKYPPQNIAKNTTAQAEINGGKVIIATTMSSQDIVSSGKSMAVVTSLPPTEPALLDQVSYFTAKLPKISIEKNGALTNSVEDENPDFRTVLRSKLVEFAKHKSRDLLIKNGLSDIQLKIPVIEIIY